MHTEQRNAEVGIESESKSSWEYGSLGCKGTERQPSKLQAAGSGPADLIAGREWGQGGSDDKQECPRGKARRAGQTCGRCFLDRLRGDASAAKVLVNEVEQHGGHVILAALVPVAVDGQPVAQVPHLLPCKPSHFSARGATSHATSMSRSHDENSHVGRVNNVLSSSAAAGTICSAQSVKPFSVSAAIVLTFLM